jgi:hypothetical protein
VSGECPGQALIEATQIDRLLGAWPSAVRLQLHLATTIVLRLHSRRIRWLSARSPIIWFRQVQVLDGLGAAFWDRENQHAQTACDCVLVDGGRLHLFLRDSGADRSLRVATFAAPTTV